MRNRAGRAALSDFPAEKPWGSILGIDGLDLGCDGQDCCLFKKDGMVESAYLRRGQSNVNEPGGIRHATGMRISWPICLLVCIFEA